MFHHLLSFSVFLNLISMNAKYLWNVFVFSERVSHLLYTRLLQQFFYNYCQVIDTQEPEKGNSMK